MGWAALPHPSALPRAHCQCPALSQHLAGKPCTSCPPATHTGLAQKGALPKPAFPWLASSSSLSLRSLNPSRSWQGG